MNSNTLKFYGGSIEKNEKNLKILGQSSKFRWTRDKIFWLIGWTCLGDFELGNFNHIILHKKRCKINFTITYTVLKPERVELGLVIRKPTFLTDFKFLTAPDISRVEIFFEKMYGQNLYLQNEVEILNYLRNKQSRFRTLDLLIKKCIKCILSIEGTCFPSCMNWLSPQNRWKRSWLSKSARISSMIV